MFFSRVVVGGLEIVSSPWINALDGAIAVLSLFHPASAEQSWTTADAGLCLTVAVALGVLTLDFVLFLFVVKSHFIRHNGFNLNG